MDDLLIVEVLQPQQHVAEALPDYNGLNDHDGGHDDDHDGHEDGHNDLDGGHGNNFQCRQCGF